MTLKTVYIVLVSLLSLQKVFGDLSEEEIKRLTSMPGHMKQFGSAGPFFNVYMVEGFPKPREFFNKYVIPSTPLLMKNAARLSPAFTKWTDEYFINHPESEKESVFAEGRKKENRSEPGYTMSFRKFVQTYNESDIYMVHGVPKHLRPDVLMPPPLLCEPVIPAILDTVTWFSSGGTKSVLHNDDVDNINCLFRGSKTLVFVNPHDGREIGDTLIDHPDGSYSSMDVDAVDYTKFPILSKVRFARVDMQAGDCLFIPYKWHHQVNSFGSNLAVNLWWSHLTEAFFDLTDEKCGDLSDRRTLDNYTYPGMPGEGAYGGEEEGGQEGQQPPPEGAQEEDQGQDGSKLEDEEKELVDGQPPVQDQEGVKKLEQEQGPYIEEQEDSLTDRIYKAIMKVQKPVVMNGLKKYVLKRYPESIQNWDERCQEILINYYGMLDQNKDTVIDTDDAKLFYEADEHTMSQYLDVTAFFESDLMGALQEATAKKEMELVKKLLDRGELDKEQIANIFGERMALAGIKRDEL